MPELCGDDFIKTGMAVEMQIVCPSEEMHCKDKPHQAQVMITVQMTYKNIVDPVKIGLKPHELHLSAFATIDQEMPVLHFDQLGRWKSAVSR